MRTRALLLLVGAALGAGGAPADDSTAAPAANACQIPGNHITGPRAGDRPLPLLSGDATHGFRLACTVPWTSLSPNNLPLPVVGCYQGSLLQLENDAACGHGTGRLWVSTRWVKTSGEAPPDPHTKATCQQLETGTYAATRDFPDQCAPSGAAPAATATGVRNLPVAPAASAASPAATGTTPAAPAAPPPGDR